MSLKIIRSGIFDTIQDIGRFGYQYLGIHPNGAMDIFAAQVGNIITNNPATDAVLEMHYPAPQIIFTKPSIIALSGADFSPAINNKPVDMWRPLFVNTGDVLTFDKYTKGARMYLALHGGFKIDKWLDSYSTNLKLKHGGYLGRALKKNDEIEFEINTTTQQKDFIREMKWKINIPEESNNEILVIKGNEWKQLDKQSKRSLKDDYFQITAQSDRMGYKLKGQTLNRKEKIEMRSSAVNFGTIQLLPNGQLIILMADHQTTGGYPRVAHVISAYQGKLAQFSAGENIKFTFTTQAVAETKAIEQQRFLNQLRSICSLRWDEYLQ